MKKTVIISFFILVIILAYFLKPTSIHRLNKKVILIDSPNNNFVFSSSKKPLLSTEEVAKQTNIKKHFNSGNYIKAVKYVEILLNNKTHNSARLNTWLYKHYPVFLLSLGWMYLKLGNCDAALYEFKKAANHSTRAEIDKGIGACYFKLQHLEKARFYVERFLAKKPLNINLNNILLEILESEQEFEEAKKRLKTLITELEKKAKNSKDLKKLYTKLQNLKTKEEELPLQDKLYYGNFIITFRATEHDYFIDHVNTTLNDALYEFIENYGFNIPKEPIEVVFYSRSNFRQIVPNSPNWAEAIFDGKIKIPISTKSNINLNVLTKILRHELIHALFMIKSNYRQIPTWLDEGLAQFASCTNLLNCKTTQLKTPLLPKKILTRSYVSLSKNNALKAYKQSLFLVKYIDMLNNKYLNNIVSSINESSRIDSNSLLSNIGLNLDSLYRRLEIK